MFRRENDAADEHFLDYDGVLSEARRNETGDALAKLVTLDGEDVAYDIIRSDFAKGAFNDWPDNLFTDGLRQICFDVVKTAGIQAIINQDRQAERQTFACLDFQHGFMRLRVILRRGGEDLLANVVDGQTLDERNNEMDASIERPGTNAGDLTDTHPGGAIRN